MPAQEQSHRKEKAVLWPLIGQDTYGRFLVGDPVEIRVRWVVNEKESTASSSDSTAVIQAKVFVNQKVEIGSNIWLGPLENWVGTSPLADENDVMQVVGYKETPDLKARNRLRTLSVIRLKDAFPVIGGRVNRSASTVSYNKTLASADNIDAIVITVVLIDTNNNPIVGRNVYAALSSNLHISLNSSPSLTNNDGLATIYLKADSPVSPQVVVQTIEDGAISDPKQLGFA